MATNPDTSMLLDPPLPSSKRRRLSLLDTIRVRNGGSNTSFLSVANTPPSAREPDGSDTEDEEDEETAQYYLNKMSDDTGRKAETVFGAGVEVWRSFGGTVYADLSEGVKRRMREEELWNQEAKEKVAGGLKRKMAAEQAAQSSFTTGTNPAPNIAPSENSKIVYPALPQDKLPFPLAHSPLPTTPYPPRTPHATQFHHSSAGIDPMGAHNRPIKPLPKRRVPLDVATNTQKLPIQGLRPQDRGDPLLHRSGLPLRQIQAVAPEQLRVRRIVSGSFGSFEGTVGRFDERAYRLGVKEDRGKGNKRDGADEEKGDGKGKENERKLDIWKGRPWLKD